jgi:hypothetical protein
MNGSERQVQPTACSALGMRGPGGSAGHGPVFTPVPVREARKPELTSARMFLSFVAGPWDLTGFWSLFPSSSFPALVSLYFSRFAEPFCENPWTRSPIFCSKKLA